MCESLSLSTPYYRPQEIILLSQPFHFWKLPGIWYLRKCNTLEENQTEVILTQLSKHTHISYLSSELNICQTEMKDKHKHRPLNFE